MPYGKAPLAGVGTDFIVVAIVGSKFILLIRELNKPLPHYNKMIAEKFEPGEAVREALIRAADEEGGFRIVVEHDRQKQTGLLLPIQVQGAAMSLQ